MPAQENDAREDHVAAGWIDDDPRQRWIEVGRIRLEEDDKDASK